MSLKQLIFYNQFISIFGILPFQSYRPRFESKVLSFFTIMNNIKSIIHDYNFYQKPNETALSIGKHAPIPNQTATMNPIINTKLEIGLRNGF